jgi:hypothetical protein
MSARTNKKREMYACPRCTSEDSRIEDYEFDIDCLTIRMWCPSCDAEWREYALLSYDGYAMDGKVYDKEGEEAYV